MVPVVQLEVFLLPLRSLQIKQSATVDDQLSSHFVYEVYTFHKWLALYNSDPVYGSETVD